MTGKQTAQPCRDGEVDVLLRCPCCGREGPELIGLYPNKGEKQYEFRCMGGGCAMSFILWGREYARWRESRRGDDAQPEAAPAPGDGSTRTVLAVLGWERESPSVQYRGLRWPVEVTNDQERRCYRARLARIDWMEDLEGATREDAVMAAAHWLKGVIDRELGGWQLGPEARDAVLSDDDRP